MADIIVTAASIVTHCEALQADIEHLRSGQEIDPEYQKVFLHGKIRAFADLGLINSEDVMAWGTQVDHAYFFAPNKDSSRNL